MAMLEIFENSDIHMIILDCWFGGEGKIYRPSSNVDDVAERRLTDLHPVMMTWQREERKLTDCHLLPMT